VRILLVSPELWGGPMASELNARGGPPNP